MTHFEPGEGDSADELALKQLFHGAVSGLEPSGDALDHLRRAVPARRARKRQALIGAAAAVVLVGTAVPALVHVAGSPGLTAAHPVNAGHGEEAQGGTGAEAETEGPTATTAPSATVPPTTAPTRDAAKGGDRPGPSGTRTGKGPAAGTDGGAARCGTGTLRSAGGYRSGPDDTGVVYGGFTVVNGSSDACLVDGDGLVGVATIGSADPNRIAVVRHSSGDPATGLPDPSQESSSVLLEPGGSYQVKFAWVPSGTCPSGETTTPTPTEPTPPAPTEPTPTPTEPTPPAPTEPTPTASGGGEGTDAGGTEAGGGTGTGTDSEETGTEGGVTTQLLRAEPLQGSVSVSHTAEPGDPTVTTVLSGACAGTVYRTGLLKN
ncbi:hypothetical protein [Streptomyces sp. CC208A]|uniref:hypothetical protein n=1 Tax=Streptomyces sp. CC208A TaxID=3044573 RepID=UPI0024A807EC|nr:hypothetical protein [Streptomyces sp. CC208A]